MGFGSSFPKPKVAIQDQNLQDSQQPMPAVIMPCILCGQATDQEEHFVTCFEQHCPVSTPVAPVVPVVPRQPVLFRLGRLPASTAVVVHSYLDLPERLTLACASRHANVLCEDEEAWGQYATSLWAALWGSAAVPDGSCGCRFSSPQHVNFIKPKVKALGLWHLRSLTRLEVVVKLVEWDDNGTGRKRARLILEPHATVADLKNRLKLRTGVGGDTIDLIYSPTHKVLSHQEAPAAAYLWLAFCGDSCARRSPRSPPLLEMMLKLFPRCHEYAEYAKS
ncbi:unnamed protein product [Symbiodinium natans]|uniref:Ubiquitin-like domain-containing protein n=1 Tax=Symbiodinium natans TaxID=878477 RepID=A0A812UUQ7_9DINO|nr:unnamed protein product [Symbiodinium natans]